MNGMLIHAEREQLDHQRARLEEILSSRNMVSADMRTDLELLLSDITQRLWELSFDAGSQNFSNQQAMQH